MSSYRGYSAGECGETEEGCPHCGDYIQRGEDVVLFEIRKCDLRTPFDPELCVTARGEYAFSRYFLHTACWQEIETDLEEQIKGAKEPPIRVAPEDCAGTCTLCGNMLRSGDPVILLTPGELRKSKKIGDTFQHNGASTLLCPQCVLAVQEETFPSWEELVDFWHGAILAEADWAPNEDELGD